MSAKVGFWDWVERYSWLVAIVTGIAGLVVVLVNLSTDSERRIKDLSDSFNKRLDSVFEKLGERQAAYNDLKTELTKLSKDHQKLSNLYANAQARRNLEEIAARPTSSTNVKIESASLISKLDAVNRSWLTAPSGNYSKALQDATEKLKSTSKSSLDLLPKSDKDVLEPLLKRSWADISKPTIRDLPSIDRSLFQLQTLPPKTGWETFVDLFKRVPWAFIVVGLMVLGKFFR